MREICQHRKLKSEKLKTLKMHLTATNANSATTNVGNSASTNSSTNNTAANNGSATNNSSTNNSGGNSTSNNNNSTSTTNNNQPLTPEQILQETYTKMTSDILAERTLGDFMSEHPGELIRTGSPLFVCTVLPNHWRSVSSKTCGSSSLRYSFSSPSFYRTKLCRWRSKWWL